MWEFLLYSETNTQKLPSSGAGHRTIRCRPDFNPDLFFFACYYHHGKRGLWNIPHLAKTHTLKKWGISRAEWIKTPVEPSLRSVKLKAAHAWLLLNNNTYRDWFHSSESWNDFTSCWAGGGLDIEAGTGIKSRTRYTQKIL